MNAEIISVGAEVISGDVSNTDASYLSQRLSRLGIRVTRHVAVDDRPESISEALAAAVARSPLIVFTGGLGPTADDMTKEVVCKSVGLELEENDASMKRLLQYFENKGEEMPHINRKQAMFPADAIVFENPIGTADGFAIESGNQCIIMLPGPPKELEAIFEQSVEDYLMQKTDTIVVSKTLKVFGMGESKIAETIASYLEQPDPVVATYVGKGDIRIKITSTGESREECEARCNQTAEEINGVLGNVVYAEENISLQEKVVSLLLQNGKKIATAESCTAGMLSEMLTDVSGASQVFEFGVSAYANRVKNEVLGVPESLLKKYGAVSSQVAEAMAKGAAQKGKADFGVGITGVAGPTGGTKEKPVGTVFVSLYDGKRCFTRKLNCNPESPREKIRLMSVMNALDMVRLYLIRDARFVPPSGQPKTEDGVVSKKKKKKKWWQTIIPLKGDSTMEVVRKVIMMVCVLVFLGSAGYIVDYLYQSYETQKMQHHYANIFHQEDLPLVDRFAELRKINPDIVGWLKVPGTKCDNPVVQTVDNNKYLNTTFEGETSKYGTLYADYRNKFEGLQLSDNTVIYGHHMKDGLMFGQLNRLRKLETYKENPVLQFTTSYDRDIMNWKIVSVFLINTEKHDATDVLFNYHIPNFKSETQFYEYLNEIQQRSFILTGVDVLYGDKLLTLSTCSYEFSDARLVVVARRVRDGESPTVDISKAKINYDVVTPKAWKYNNNHKTKPYQAQSQNTESVVSDPALQSAISQPNVQTIVSQPAAQQGGFTQNIQPVISQPAMSNPTIQSSPSQSTDADQKPDANRPTVSSKPKPPANQSDTPASSQSASKPVQHVPSSTPQQRPPVDQSSPDLSTPEGDDDLVIEPESPEDDDDLVVDVPEETPPEEQPPEEQPPEEQPEENPEGDEPSFDDSVLT